jgi:hypothetical protein
MCPVELKNNNHSADEGQKQFSSYSNDQTILGWLWGRRQPAATSGQKLKIELPILETVAGQWLV